MSRKIAIIGSTGSIGNQTLEVIRAHPGLFEVEALACFQDIEALEKQIMLFKPRVAAVYKREPAKKLAAKLKTRSSVKIFSGKESWEKVATLKSAKKIIFSSNGLAATPALIKAIKAHKEIALANKEILVAAGRLIMDLAKKHGVEIVPVDSEHSAIFQCLRGEKIENVEKIILTCSGGPFYGQGQERISRATAVEALAHPTWTMGNKISIDSATLMNKGFEMIEAMHLFGLAENQVEIVIHPESIVHSMVQFKDGSIKAQLSAPDMRLPILYALAYPKRVKTALPKMDIKKIGKLTFIPPDFSVLKGPVIAKQAWLKGGLAPAIMVKANETAVAKFLAGEIGFLEIYNYILRNLNSGRPRAQRNLSLANLEKLGNEAGMKC